MKKSLPFVLFVIGLSVSVHAQFSKNFATYVGYAIINEPNITLEYRFHKRLAANLEGAAFVPFKNEMQVGGVGSELGYRINGRGGAIRAGIAVYGKRRFGIMHRVMADITYFSSNLYKERYGVITVEDNFYREFVQYGVFYEMTFRLFARQKRHHLFVRVGMAVRGLHTTTESSHIAGEPPVAPAPYRFRTVPAPILAVGYRFRLHPQRGYFVND